MKMQYKVFFPLAAIAIASGCFEHREAPERLVSASGISAAEEIAADVQAVDLSGLSTNGVPASLAGMPRLSHLYLRGGSFADFSALGGCRAIEVLDLGRVRLQAMPQEILGLGHLRDLYLDDCGLGAFPAGLEELPALRYLNLDRNAIAALPEALPPNLLWLRLNGNRIAALPDGIGDVRGLKRLYLRGNSLTNLPAALGRCEGLTDIDLSRNSLDGFPEVLATLPALRNLDLSGNAKIADLPDDATLGEMRALRTLRLTGCPLDNEKRARVRAALDPKCAIVF